LLKGRGEQVLTALVVTLVLMGLVALAPAVAQRLSTPPATSPTPSPSTSAAPAAVLLPDELDKALQGVMTLGNDHSFGTAFLIDARGDFLTASSLVEGSAGLRLIDNTGGTHSVRLIGSDPASGIAMVRASSDGTALAFAKSPKVLVGDPLVLLASPKIANLNPSSPATVAAVTLAQWRLRVDALSGNLGGPVVGPGAAVLGILVQPGTAAAIDAVKTTIAGWQSQPGTAVPLAPFPGTLQLRGSDTTTAPTTGLAVTSISPSRISAGTATVVTIQGNGFIAGRSLGVHFAPVSGTAGAFEGTAATLVSGTSFTVKVPSGRAVQDYVIVVSNGDGAVLSTRIALTITP
jgi:hypothetical protein